jgi:protein O-mannosyl-transferase
MAANRNSRAARKSALKRTSTASESADAHPSWLWFGGALLAAGLVYGPALNGPFIFDDVHLPFADPHAGKAPPLFWIGGVRPVVMATYWANFLMSGMAAFPYHAVNLLIHVFTSVFVFFLLERLFDLARLPMDRRWSAFFGAGVFLLHPLQTEAVAYVAGRPEEMAGFFFVTAWLAFLNDFKSEMTALRSIGILVLAAAAVLSKESAISLPAILLLTDFYWNPGRPKQWIRRRMKLYAPLVFAGLAGASEILHKFGTGPSPAFVVPGVTPGLYALTQCRVILTYIRLFLIPVGQNGDWGMAFYRSLGDGAAWFWMLAFAAVVALIAWSYRRARLLSFGLSTFLVLLLPTSSVVPIRDAIAERRMYVPIIGLIIALIASIWVLQQLRPGLRTLRAATTGIPIVVLLVLGGLTFERSGVWGSDILFWRNSTDQNPANSRAHLGLGAAYLMHNRCVEAIREFEIVEREDRITDEMTTNLAAAYQCNHQPDVALKDLRAIVLRHPSANLYAQIGYLEGALGHAGEAMSALNEAISRDPNNALAYAYRGAARLALGDREKATEDLQKSLEIDPGNKTAVSAMTRLLQRP